MQRNRFGAMQIIRIIREAEVHNLRTSFRVSTRHWEFSLSVVKGHAVNGLEQLFIADPTDVPGDCVLNELNSQGSQMNYRLNRIIQQYCHRILIL
jgi:hypothetical protein